MNTFEKTLNTYKLIPVISLPSVDSGLRLAELMTKHNFLIAEITFRTEYAARGITAIKKEFPDMTMLAGTILFPSQANEAIDAGAEAIVSPGTEATLLDHCNSLRVPVIPGVCTASEIQLALTKRISTLKFFPAELSGGTPAIKAMLSIYKDKVSFMPTGGITSANVLNYLAIDRVICCGATWLAPEKMLAAGDWEKINSRFQEAAALLKSD